MHHSFGMAVLNEQHVVFYCACSWWVQARYTSPLEDMTPVMNEGAIQWLGHFEERVITPRLAALGMADTSTEKGDET